MWRKGLHDKWTRSDGAVVRWDQSSPYPNPANPRSRMWIAFGPEPGGEYLRQTSKHGLEWPRRWKTAEAAMKAVDREFPEPKLRRFSEGPVPGPDCESLMPEGAEVFLSPRPLRYRPCFINISLSVGQSLIQHLTERHGGDAGDLAKFKPDDLWRIHDLLHVEEKKAGARRVRELEQRLEELCK